MKKLFVALFILIGIHAYGQSPLQPGQAQVNFGLGFDDQSTPVYAGLDYGMWSNVTIGGQLGVSGDYFALGGNINYHFDELFLLPSEWNVYGGGSLSFLSFNNDDSGINLNLGAHIGGRYFINNQWAVNLELGGGNEVSGGKVGATFAF